ncbi:hypothetical protein Pfo_026969 [Paulownia fortunei]|nr:hypothetical protein Pfo_026969 [Paulownia fortunei]
MKFVNKLHFSSHDLAYVCFWSLQWPMPLGLESGKGIGIVNFFEGKNIFVTGATGLLGKVLVEKILRSTPVGKIYVLVKADDPEAAMDRMAKELINSELFECLQEKHGNYYQAFIREKLIPVVGNICEPNLGMDSDSARAIMEEVNVIVESAAITTLNERLNIYIIRYDLLLDTNVNAPQRLMRFAKTCKNLELLVHISTAYVNGEKEGIILEKPLTMGENRRKESGETSSSLFPRLDVADEVNLALRSCTASTNYDVTKDMKRLGMERAKLYGWYNTYHLTKAMAEMVIHETKGDIPVLIIRPTVIESCYKEPVPGWIQGNRMFDPIIISYGKGQLPAFLGNPDTPMDVIPLDIVVNATIAAIAKHGYMHKSELNVYQMASGVVNPLRYSEFFEYIYECFDSEPLIESKSFTRINYYDDLNKIKYFDNFNDFSKYTREEISRRLGMRNAVGIDVKRTQKLQKQLKAKVTYAEQLCKMYEFLGFFKARFHAGNIQKLLSEMSEEEQINFAIDVRKIDWRKYFQEVHIPGLRNHVLNDKRISV